MVSCFSNIFLIVGCLMWTCTL